MLASITPLGERGRQSTWGVTVTAFLLGATAAGAAVGAGLGTVGVGLGAAFDGREIMLAAATLVAIGLDAFGAVPGPRRQVDERWLERYRGWVYGLGFGAQLGVGVTTVVSSAATYLTVIAALLSASAVQGALIVGCFGCVRGVTLLAAAGVRRPDQLLAFHRRFERLEPLAARGGIVLLSAAFVAGLT
jgi:sulfite exporter TauE/SafE